MAYALVGSAGTQVVGASGAAVSTEAYGQTPTAGHLLICFVAGAGVATSPTTPAGWSIGKNGTGNSTAATIFYKIAAGSDAVPTIAALTSQIWSVQLCEFSGNSGVPLDQTGTATGTSSPVQATAGGVDAAIGDLLLFVGSELTSTSVTRTLTNTLTNASATVTGNNSATSATSHYTFGYGVTTANSVADADSIALSSTSKETGFTVSIASFKASQQFTQALSGNLNFMVSGFVTAGPHPAPYVRKLPLPWELLPR